MLAIVIPYYKISFFEKTLQSVKNQSNSAFKVYIGNDNSPNDPQVIIDKYKTEFNLFYKKFDKNLGSISLTSHWQRCIDIVEDEKWIMILGDDDILEENVVDEFYKNLDEINKSSINVIRFSTQIINNFDDEISFVYKTETIQNSKDILIEKFNGKNRSSLSEYIFSTKELKQNQIPNYFLAWHTDDMLILKNSNFGNVFGINESRVKVRMSNENISSLNTNFYLKEAATIQFFTEIFKVFKNRFSNDELDHFCIRLDSIYLNHLKKISLYLIIIKLYLINNKYSLIIRFHNKIFKTIFSKTIG